jgi:hypothetical protein
MKDLMAMAADAAARRECDAAARRECDDAFFLEVWKREVLWDYLENPTEELRIERDRIWAMT